MKLVLDERSRPILVVVFVCMHNVVDYVNDQVKWCFMVMVIM